MRKHILVTPTYALYGEVITLIIESSDNGKVSAEELADALRDYADFIDEEIEGAH